MEEKNEIFIVIGSKVTSPRNGITYEWPIGYFSNEEAAKKAAKGRGETTNEFSDVNTINGDIKKVKVYSSYEEFCAAKGLSK